MIPTFSERESNARRVVIIGAGEIILPTEGTGREKSIDIDKLRLKIRKILADPSYTINAQKARDKLRAFGGAMNAADQIADFCGDE